MDQLIQTIESMDPADVAVGVGVVGILTVLTIVWLVLWYFISALGFFKMNKKAGEAGWMAFVPVLNRYIRFKISWKPVFFWVYCACTIVMNLFGQSESVGLSFLALAACIATLVIHIKMNIKLAKSFGKSGAWGILLFAFPFIGSLILGFGKAEYVGKSDVKAIPEA